MAKAACALEAVSRWAVTGTPIQNRLADLAALLSFIRAHPYTDPKTFDADISHLWKSGEEEEAAKRLKNLSAYLLLRRPKQIIELPRRLDRKCTVDLYPEERELYKSIHDQVLIEIDEAMQMGSETSRAAIYAKTLQKITSLRLICDLGLHYRGRHADSSSKTANFQPALSTKSDSEETREASLQSIFDMRRDLDEIECIQCSSRFGPTDAFLGDAVSKHQNMAWFSRCQKFLCISCVKTQRQAEISFPCGHLPPCLAEAVNPYLTEEVAGHEAKAYTSEGTDDVVRLPSKVEALLLDLKSLPPNTKCLIFSAWRLTLDVIQKGLDQASIQSTRFDGEIPQKGRQAVVDKFRNDQNISVMLLTLSCGAVGQVVFCSPTFCSRMLTLCTLQSESNRRDPNPTLEEQALARIHRLGQTKEVTTVRFFARNTFEEARHTLILFLFEFVDFRSSLLTFHRKS
ncbi:DNA repair protein rad5 [Grosmannia clavigera kw1407]|uniref:DNA repair protein rad5 n=1 Tax=Grosmannia clavigera (strain kw1407 / UAMH 11150) TaxID=655863 RepID=F0XAN3_GROCL|nr:DNA repair protein rad5 [Grosmannia clavigera kw1407]EFX06157.1 DNA repair protein rad5 [Grosmannia clavigera kw1407]